MSADGLTVSQSMRPSPIWTWLALAALASTLVWSSVYLVDRAHVTPTELGEKLVTESFEGEVPPGVDLGSRGLDKTPNGGGAVAASLRFEEDARIRGFGGSPAVIQYWVWQSPAQAERRLHEYLTELREAKRAHGYRQEITPLHDEYPGFCLREPSGPQDFCQAVIDNVWMEALSRIDQLGVADKSYVNSLMKAGVEHLETALAQ